MFTEEVIQAIFLIAIGTYLLLIAPCIFMLLFSFPGERENNADRNKDPLLLK